jgi:hypothetical protein
MNQHRRHSQKLRFGRIMPPPKPLISLPVHSFGLRWERFEHAQAASKLLADFLRPHEVTDARRRLLCCIGEPVAMPIAPRPTARSVQLFYHALAIALNIKSLSPNWTPARRVQLEGRLRPLHPCPSPQTRCEVWACVDARSANSTKTIGRAGVEFKFP